MSKDPFLHTHSTFVMAFIMEAFVAFGLLMASFISCGRMRRWIRCCKVCNDLAVIAQKCLNVGIPDVVQASSIVSSNSAVMSIQCFILHSHPMTNEECPRTILHCIRDTLTLIFGFPTLEYTTYSDMISHSVQSLGPDWVPGASTEVLSSRTRSVPCITIKKVTPRLHMSICQEILRMKWPHLHKTDISCLKVIALSQDHLWCHEGWRTANLPTLILPKVRLPQLAINDY